VLKISTVKSNDRRPTAIRLTPNQAAVLTSLAEGFTVAEVAVHWGVSETVVYRNIEGARRTLGAQTTAHAIAIWVEMKLGRKIGENGRRNGTSESVVT
jgi:DNA-binding NarL/FixJ family response regulator